MDVWRFLNTGPADGAINMAVDEAILLAITRGESPPTIRVYSWDPPTVSTGYSQDPARELDLAACARRGFGIVRRPTGGRAVLHAGELTYAVVGSSGRPPLGTTIHEAYRTIADALLEGLRELGVEADLARVGSSGPPRGRAAAAPCFVSSGRSEIVVAGRKLVGSAQRRVGGGVLQHGSVLMDATHVEIADLLALSHVARRRVRELLRARTTDLATIVGRRVSFEEVAAALRAGFERSWGLGLHEGRLSEAEKDAARSLATGYAVEA